jgi:hypothetical protein
MRTFHGDVRLEDLAGSDFVYAECKCGRTDLLTRGMLKGMGLQPDEKLIGLGKRLRCQRRGQLGRVTVSIEWAGRDSQ